MKWIDKGPEPAALQQYRLSTPDATYEGFSDKQAIREALVKEQGGLCAYCMQRIRAELPSKRATDIEHYRSQDQFLELQLAYNNMLGVCKGGSAQKGGLLHCDKSKDQQQHKSLLPLVVDPLDAATLEQICYRKDGTIYAKDNQRLEIELNQLLNLNEAYLKAYRKDAIVAAYERVQQLHGQNFKRTYKKSIVQKVINKWEKRFLDKRAKQPMYVYYEYCAAPLYHLKKLLRKAT